MAIHGIDPKKHFKEEVTSSSQTDGVFAFRDPEEYNHLSQEEREELTAKMMGAHKDWVKREASRWQIKI